MKLSSFFVRSAPVRRNTIPAPLALPTFDGPVERALYFMSLDATPLSKAEHEAAAASSDEETVNA